MVELSKGLVKDIAWELRHVVKSDHVRLVIESIKRRQKEKEKYEKERSKYPRRAPHKIPVEMANNVQKVRKA